MEVHHMARIGWVCDHCDAYRFLVSRLQTRWLMLLHACVQPPSRTDNVICSTNAGGWIHGQVLGEDRQTVSEILSEQRSTSEPRREGCPRECLQLLTDRCVLAWWWNLENAPSGIRRCFTPYIPISIVEISSSRSVPWLYRNYLLPTSNMLLVIRSDWFVTYNHFPTRCDTVQVCV